MNLLAVAQFAPGPDPTANLAVIGRLTANAVARGASLVVLPEYSSYFTAEMGPDWVAAAQPVDGPFVQELGALARRHGIHLVAGLVERVEGETERVSNTLVVVDPAGAVVATYRKLHLYDAFGMRESDWVVPGTIEAPQTFVWGDVTVGLQTCYDLRFPEITRRLVDAGADVVLVPSEWVRGPLKEQHWRTLITARAIENTIYVAAADHTPPIGVGASMIVDPMGIALASLGEIEGIGIAGVDPDRIAAVRETNPALALRRFGVGPR